MGRRLERGTFAPLKEGNGLWAKRPGKNGRGIPLIDLFVTGEGPRKTKGSIDPNRLAGEIAEIAKRRKTIKPSS